VADAIGAANYVPNLGAARRRGSPRAISRNSDFSVSRSAVSVGLAAAGQAAVQESLLQVSELLPRYALVSSPGAREH
jgi:hypothetical protein